MNAPVILAQLLGTTSPNANPPRHIKLEKPQGGATVTVNLDGHTQLDFSDIASEKLTFVRVGEKLIVLFDNQSTVTIDPVFGSDGHPLADISFEMAPDRLLSGDQFASTFPVTTDQSILPAAGPGGNGPTAGAHFGDPTVDPLSIGTPLALLGPEAFGSTFGTLTDQGANSSPVAGAITTAIVNEDGLPGGNPGGLGDVGGTVTSVTGSLNINFGTSLSGRTATFDANQPGLAGLSSDGQVVHVFITTIGGLPTLIGYVGTDPSVVANEVFTVSLNVNATLQGEYTFTLLRALDHPIVGIEDNLDLNIAVTGTNGVGQTVSTSIPVEVNDDSPIINVANETHSTITDPLTGAVSTATGSLGISFGADSFNDHVDGGVSATTGKDGDRAVIFSDAVVTVTGEASGVGTPIAALTSDGAVVHYELLNNGTELVAYTGNTAPTAFPTDAVTAASEHVVFTVSLSDGPSTGSYVISQYQSLDHNTGSTLFDAINLSFNFTAIDSDGDPVSGTLTATVDDTAPIVAEAQVTHSTLTDPLNSSQSTAAGTLGISWGADSANAVVDGGVLAADGDRAVIFSNANVTATGSTSNGDSGVVVTGITGLTSENQVVHYVLLDNGTVLVAYTGDTVPTTVPTSTPNSGPQPEFEGDNPVNQNPANIVFVVTLTDDSATGGYTVTQYQPLDHIANGTKFDSIDLTFNFTAVDSDGDPATGTLTVTVDDTVPTIIGRIFDQTVGEDGLSDGNHIKGDVQDVVASSSLGVDWGADNEIVSAGSSFGRTLTFLAGDDSTAIAGSSATVSSLAMVLSGEQGTSLTSGGVALVYVVTSDGSGGEVLTAYKGSTAGAVIFTLALDATATDGAYTFTLDGPLDHAAGSNSIALTFTVQATDADGDAVQQTFAVDVQDDTPVITGTIADQTVGEEGLTGANHNLPGEAQNASTGVVSLNIAWGADDNNSGTTNNRTVTFASTTLGTLQGMHLTSDGQALSYSITTDSNGEQLLTATAGSGNGAHTIFTVQLSDADNGSYDLTLLGNLDHPAGNGANDIALTFNVVGTDDDGDTVGQTFTVDVQDDVPVAGVGQAETVKEANLPWGSSPDLHDLTVTGNLNVSWGADSNDSGNTNNRSVSFQFGNAASDVQVTDANGNTITGLTSDGATVHYAIVNGVLVGYTGSDPHFHQVFTVSLNDDGTGSYTFTLLGNLDHPTGQGTNTLNLTFDYTATDSDGDPSSNTFTVTVKDDVPIAHVGDSGFVNEANLPDGNFPLFFSYPQASGDLNITWGADNNDSGTTNDRSVSFQFSSAASDVAVTNGSGQAITGLTSDGATVNYAILNGVLVGYTGSDPHFHQVFTVSLNDDFSGSYTFTLLGNLDHPTGQGANLLNFTFDYTATDSDGDTSSSTFTVSVKDSVPIAFGGDTGFVDEDNLPSGTSPHASALATTQDLNIAWGADNNNSGTTNVRSVAFTNTNMGVSDGFHSFSSLTADGLTVHTALINGVLVGYTGNAVPASATGAGVVFNISLNDNGDGSYTFTLLGNLDHPNGGGQNTLDLTFNYTATDSDGDTSSSSFTVDVKDDVPVVTGSVATHNVGEDGLPGANLTGGSFDAVNNLSTGVVSLNIDWGADNAIKSAQDPNGRTLAFNYSTDRFGNITPLDSQGHALNLTSNGIALQYVITTSANGTQELDAYSSSTHNAGSLVFSVVLDPTAANGSYDFTLASNLDHPASGQQDDNLLLNFGVTATDSDGDSVQQNFTVDVQDDVPVVTAVAAQTVGEEGLAGANTINGDAHNASTGTVSLNISWGADSNNPTSGSGAHDRSVTFASTTVSDFNALNLTSNGQALSYVISQDSTGSLLTASAGGHTVFTVQLSDANNGSYDFTLLDNLDHPAVQGANTDTLTFNVVATDSDGDTAAQSFAVSVQDDVPVVTAVAAQTVGEEGLAGANTINGDAHNASTGTVSLNISWGADSNNPTSGSGTHDRSVTFASTTVSDFNALNLTSNGVALTYVISQDSTGALLTASAGGHTVFTVQLSDANNGSYDFTLLDNLDHPAVQGANTDTLTFNVVAKDSDGDTAAQSFAVSVQDDVPVVTAVTAQTVGEEGLVTGNHNLPNEAQNASTGTVSLNISWGADSNNPTSGSGMHDRSVTFASTTVNDFNALNLTSNGVALTYVISQDSTGALLTASAGGHTVFTVQLSDANNGSYDFTLLGNLDHPAGQGANFENLTFNVVATDSDGDTAAQSFTVNVQDDLPTVGTPAATTVLEDTLVTQSSATSHGSLGISFGADGPAAVADGTITTTPHTFNFDNGTNVGAGFSATAWQFRSGFGATALVGAQGAPVVFKETDGHAFELSSVSLGLFGTPTGGLNGQVVEIFGLDANGNVISGVHALVTITTLTSADTGQTTMTFNAAGTPFANLEIYGLSINPVTSFAGEVYVDNLNIGSVVSDTSHQVVSAPVVFANQASAVANISIVDDHGNAVSAATLTSHGQTIHYELLDAVTLVGYTGSTAPTSISGSNVVFSVVLSENAGNPNGAYDFTLYKPLDDLPASVTDLKLSFNFTATDGDGDTAPGAFTIDVHDDVPTLVALTPVAIVDGNFLGTAGVDFPTPASWSQPLGAIDTKGSILGWTYTASTVNGATIGNVELERVDSGYAGSFSTDGNPMVDLEASPGNIQISQTVTGLTAGEQILISFEIGEANFGNAKLAVLWDGQIVGTFDPQNGLMQLESIAVTAIGNNNDVLTFREIGISGDNTGTFLTDVSAQQIAGSVYEGGLNVPFDLAANALPAIVGNEQGAAVTTTGSLAGLVHFGADGPAMNGNTNNGFQFAVQNNIDATSFVTGLHLTSLGFSVDQATLSGNTLTATAQDGHNVFTLALNGDGSWTFTLLAPLDDAHLGADSIAIDFSSLVKAVDFDGDSIALSAGSFEVAVIDDVPVVTAAADSVSVSEHGLTGVPSVQAAVGFLHISWGADDGAAKHLAFAADSNGQFGPALTSGGVALDYVVTTINNSGTIEPELIAYKHGGDPSNPVFTITLYNPPGENAPYYAFALFQPLDESGAGADTVALNFNVSATDSDGDSVLQNFTVNVTDDVPVVTTVAAQTVGEEGLSGANTIMGDAHNASTGPVSLNISWGADNNNPTSGSGPYDRSVTFASDTVSALNALNLTSNGQALSYVVSQDSTGALLTASAGGHAVFTVQLSDSDNGSYNFTLLDNLDHPAGQGANSDALTFNVVATDSDGDTAAQSFTVDVQDDVPVVTAVTAQTVGEEGLADANHNLPGEAQNASTGTVSLNISWGADNNNPTSGSGAYDRSVTFSSDTVSALNALNLTSNGQALSYVVSQDSTGALLTASAGGHAVFTVQLSDSDNGSYNFTLLDNLDHPAGQGANSDALTFNVVATDSDGDTAAQSFTVAVQDDVPVANPDTATVAEATSVSGNVITGNAITHAGADGVGADGALVTSAGSVTAGHAATVGAGGVLTVIGEYGTLTLNPGGSYTYVANSNISNASPVNDVFAYILTDGDGDTSATTLTISVSDGANPTVTGSVSLTVDEAALDTVKDGNDIQAGLVTGSNPTSTGETQQSTGLTFTAHSDNIVSIGFGAVGSTVTGITVSGAAAGSTFTWVVDSSGDLEGHIGGASGPLGIILSITGTTTAAAGGGTATPTITATLTDAFPDAPGSSPITVSGIQVTATDIDGSQVSSSIGVTIKDDVPVAHGDVATVGEAGSGATNVVFIMDTSGSTDGSTLATEKAAAINLLNAGINGGQVLVVDFNDSTHNSGWVSVSAAIAYINGLTAGGDTNYDAALQGVETFFATHTTPAAAQTIAYFLSDGQPNEPIGSVGISPSEQASWDSFLATNHISTVYGVKIGSTSPDSDIAPIADPSGDNIGIGNNANGLVGTIPSVPHTVSGNVLTNDVFGADGHGTGAGILSIVVGTDTYTYNGTNITDSHGVITTGSVLNATGVDGNLTFYFNAVSGHAAGDYVYTATAAVSSDQTETFHYTIVDGDGDTSAADLVITIKNAPHAPVGLDLAAADDSFSAADPAGTNSDNVTNHTSGLTISGAAENGTTVTLFDDVNGDGILDNGEVALATSAVVTNGTFTVDISLAQGIHNIVGFETDASGNTSPGSAALAITVDTTAPTATVTGFVNDSGVVGDHITNDQTLTITGTGEANTEVAVFQNNTQIGMTLVDSNGNWSVTDNNVLSNGQTYQFTAQATDLAGNTGAVSASYAATIDTTKPTETIHISAISVDTGISSTDFVTSDQTLTVTGTNSTLAAGDKVQISTDGGNSWADATSVTSTTWSYADPATHTTNFTYEARIVDVAGNIDNNIASQNVTIDLTPPTNNVAISDIVSDTGASSTDFITKDTTLTVEGTYSGNLGSNVIQISTDNGATWNNVSIGFFNSWSYTDPTTHTNGSFTYEVRVIDLAGNVGNTDSQLVTVDTTPPTVAVDIVTTSLSDSHATSNVTFTFSETPVGFNSADISTTNGSISNLTQVDATHYTATFTAADNVSGSGSVSVGTGYTDTAGNTGVAGSDTVTIDTKNPTVTSIVMSDTSLVVGETSTVTFTFSEAVTGFTTSDVTAPNGILSGLTTTNGGVTWTATFTPTADIHDTTNVLTVQSGSYTDLVGNTGASGTSANYSVDTIPAPVFSSPDTASVNEGVAAHSTVYTAVATNADHEAMTYSLSGTDASSFSINSSTGVVTIDNSPNFETKSSYSFNVVATETTGESSTEQVTLTINDVAPSTPVDSNANANTVAEGAANGTTVGVTVSSTDVNGPAVTYSLTGDTSGGGFTINSSTGVITVADGSKLNYETAAGHAYTVTAQASDGTLTSSQTFTIAVTDVAPTTPVDSNAATNTVAEGAAIGTTVGITASSTDVNGPAVTYSLTGDTSGGGFTINSSTGVITVADPSKIDYESASGHAYTVTAQASDGTLTSSQSFTIAVTDIAPSTPVDSNANANTVAEGAANGTTVGITASSTDVNGPAVTYSLTGDTSGGGFTINSSTGVITVADGSKLNYETAAGHAYTVTAQASDGTLTSSQTFTIAVTDVAPSTPVDSNANANTVAEGAAIGTTVGITASSTDVNGPAVTYSLTGDTSGGGFTINSSTGVITVADPSKIDYESASGHAYTVTAQASDGTLTSSQSFTIAVTDVAPSTPVDSNANANTVAEGAANGTTVGITASSTDVNGPAVTYSLTGDTSGGGFTINSSTGVITVADGSKLNYETAAGHAYTVTAQASDGTLTSSQTFTIAVTDVAPSTPVDSNANANTVAEGAAIGTTVGITASSTDVNGPAVTYSLTGDTSGGGFTINSSTGVITVADPSKIDYESASGHAYTVTAQASDGTLTSSQSFTIAVTDVAPSTPVDSNANANTVAEGAANGTTVGITASSTDVNGPAVTYSLTGDTSGGGFTINSSTGVITVADGSKLNYETAAGHAYTVTAQASDGTLTSSQTFTIAVTDVAPTTPVDSNANANTVAEGAAIGTTVGITASSTDVNGPAVIYSLTGDTSGGGFTINSSTGVITVADPSKIDYESASGHAYTVTAQASDGTLTSSQSFTIAVTDVAPSTPVDSNANANTVAEGAANGTTVGITASSTDVNGPAVTYSLTGDTSGGGFTINAATGVITVADGTKIDYETASGHAYTVTAQASDGTLTSSQTFTIAVSDVAPTNTVPGAQTVASGASLVFNTAHSDLISVSDPNGATLTETLTVSHGTLSLGETSGLTFTAGDGTGDATMTFTGSQANVDAALSGLSYVSAAGYSGSDTLSVKSSDGTLSDTDTVAITVQSANHPPVVTGHTDGTVTEDATAAISSGNLVTNGSFGAPFTLAGWTAAGNSNVQVSGSSEDADGGEANFDDNKSGTETLSQSITTVAGQTYTVNFWLTNWNSGGTNSFSVLWNGTLISGSTVTNVPGTLNNYTEYTYQVVATGSSSPLTFSGTQSSSVTGWLLDNISVIATTPAAEKTTGTITFTDADTTDVHTLSQAAPTFTWSGGTLTQPQITALTNASALTLSETESAGHGTVNWSYQIADSAIQFLSAGQTLTETYAVTIDDGHGGTTSQNVTLTVNGTSPVVSSEAITSATGVQNNYLNANDVVTVTVAMNEVVTVTGTPQLALVIGSTTVEANYVSGSGTSSLVFSYTILSGQTDTNGISIPANALSLNGGTITDIDGKTAVLTAVAVTDNSNYMVDTTAPTVTKTLFSGTTLTGTYSDSGSGVVSVFVTDSTNGHKFTNASANLSGGVWTLTNSSLHSGDSLKIVATDAAGNTSTTLSTTAPAGVSGAPINLALTDYSDHSGMIAATITGLAAGWILSEGIHNADGSWSVLTSDIGSLSVTSPDGYVGALVAQVSESWTNADGTHGTAYVPDNVEAYAKGSPIFAWSGDDTLTASIGDDTLVFANQIGNDVVHNFDTLHDKIDLIGFNGFASFADVQAHLGHDAMGNAVITLGNGETITLTGIDAGTLTAADFQFDQTPVTYNTGDMVISDGALLPLSGIVDNTGSIHLSSAGTETDLEIVQHGATFEGGGTLVLSDNSENVIYGSDQSVTLTNVDNTISGAGHLGDGQMTLVNEGTIIADGINALDIDTGSNVIANSGTLEATGAGGLVVHSDLANDGLLWANGGNVTLDGDVSGSGSALISGNASLEIGGAFGEQVKFDDNASGTLKIDHSADFSGMISGFGEHDTIDLSDILATTASINYTANSGNTGGVLTVTDGSTTANIAMTGQYASADFHLAADQTNHVLVQLEQHAQQMAAA